MFVSKTSPLAFSFDDPPIKVEMGELLEDATTSTEFYIMDSSPVNFGDISLDEDHRVLAMKKSGCGTKPFQRWLKEEVDYDGGNPSHPSMAFWQSQYKKWRLYDFFCDPKVLAAHDLMETLVMRLSFHLRNEKLLQTFREGEVYFGPFTPNDGAYDLSYYSLAWYLENLGDDQERELERQWCEYAMGVAEGDYLEELVKLGYGEGRIHMDAKVFRDEMMSYVMKLRNQVNRNDMAHVFSTSVKQVWMKVDVYAKTKNRCLLDQPAAALEDGHKKKLIAILEDLAIDMPTGLQALVNVIPMQAYFLKTVLQKPVLDAVLPKPAKLPRKLPPPIK